MESLTEFVTEEDRTGSHQRGLFSVIFNLVQIDDSELPQSVRNMFACSNDAEETDK